MPKKIINNIAMDTAFFVEQNFLAGAKLKEIAKLSKEKVIKAHITDITYREVLSRATQSLKKAEEEIKKPKSLLEASARVLKNFPQHNIYFDLPKVDVTTLYGEFKGRFDKWIKENKIIIIKTDDLVIGEIMNDYFSNNPPFKEGKKKHEFPDAFTLKALCDYFDSLNEKSHFLSSDKDILSFKSNALIPTSDSTELIDTLIRAQEEKKKTKTILFIEKIFEKERGELEEDLAKTIESYVEHEIREAVRNRNFGLFNFRYTEVSNIQIGSISINYLDENYANCEAAISFDLNVEFLTINHSESWYDVGLGFSYSAAPASNRIKTSMDSTASFFITHKPMKGEVVSVGVDLINEGQDFEIMQYVEH